MPSQPNFASQPRPTFAFSPTRIIQQPHPTEPLNRPHVFHPFENHPVHGTLDVIVDENTVFILRLWVDGFGFGVVVDGRDERGGAGVEAVQWEHENLAVSLRRRSWRIRWVRFVKVEFGAVFEGFETGAAAALRCWWA